MNSLRWNSPIISVVLSLCKYLALKPLVIEANGNAKSESAKTRNIRLRKKVCFCLWNYKICVLGKICSAHWQVGLQIFVCGVWGTHFQWAYSASFIFDAILICGITCLVFLLFHLSLQIMVLASLDQFNGTATKPRLSVFCSDKQLYAMVVDDQNKRCLFYGSTLQKSIRQDLSCTTIVSAPSQINTTILYSLPNYAPKFQ